MHCSENRTFPPSEAFKDQALVADTPLRRGGAGLPGLLGPPGRRAARLATDWHTICEWELPFSKWFVGGQLNVSDNCLDRHVPAGHGDRVAFHWEGEPGDTRTITYADLLDRGAALRQRAQGPRRRAKGDRVDIYLPMIPEAAVAMLACARIGAAHSVVFGGFCAESLTRPHQRLPRPRC